MSPSLPLTSLVFNAALLLVVVLVLDLATSQRQVESLKGRQWLTGVILGGIGIGVMMAPLTLMPGLIFDVRSVLLAIAGLFFGPLPTALAMAMTVAYRLAFGGVAAWAGVVVILASGLIGIAWRHYRHHRHDRRPPLDAIGWRELLALGLVVHLVMLAVLLLMLGGIARDVLTEIALPVMLVHPLLTVALGLLLSRRMNYQASLRLLQQSEQRYHSLFDNSHTVMLIVDPVSGAIVAANPAAAGYYGWSQAELAGMNIAAINTLPAAEIGAEMGRARARQSNRFEFRHRRADGSVRDVEVFSGPIQVGDRQLLYTIVHDNSERKQAEAKLVESEARRAAEQTAALEDQRRGRIAALNLMDDAIAAKARAEASLAELKENKERLKLALQAANQGIYDFNMQTGEIIVSPEYATMLGYDPADFHETNASWLERLHPDDYPRVAQHYRDYLAGKLPEYRVEVRQKTRAGDWKWILTLGRVVASDAAGRPLRMVGTHTDIDQQKRAEAERHALEARYRDLFDANPHPMWVYDQETLAFLAVNDAAIAHYGYGRDEFLAMTIEDIRPAQDVPALLAALERSREGLNESGVWRHCRKDGSVILVEIASHSLDFGGRRAQAVLAHDVTQARQIEAALRKSEQMFRALFDNNMDAVLLTSPDGDILAANHQAQFLFGRSEEELRAVGRGGVVDASDPRLPAALAELEKLGRFRGELTLVDADGRRFSAEVSSIAFTASDGRSMTSLIARDITERKLAAEKDQQQLKELRQWYELTLGRESRVLELKTEVNALLRTLGAAPRYSSVEAGESAADGATIDEGG
ncbi:MAG: PAS domain S-box protein [Sulfuritalea sp.]|nr:PAS domain S-box protein [Sulfuritalea sp.]